MIHHWWVIQIDCYFEKIIVNGETSVASIASVQELGVDSNLISGKLLRPTRECLGTKASPARNQATVEIKVENSIRFSLSFELNP